MTKPKRKPAPKPKRKPRKHCKSCTCHEPATGSVADMLPGGGVGATMGMTV